MWLIALDFGQTVSINGQLFARISCNMDHARLRHKCIDSQRVGEQNKFCSQKPNIEYKTNVIFHKFQIQYKV